MSYPDKPASPYDYASYQESNPADPLPAPELAADLAHLKASVDATIDFLKVSLRSDNRVAPKMVPASALTPDVLTLLGTWNQRGAWATATAYAVNDLVTIGQAFYVAAVAHTSGATFGVDFLAGKWINIAGAQYNIVTPQMFGAIGDGTTDDSAAFAAALAQPYPLEVPAGTYAVKNISLTPTCPSMSSVGGAKIVPASGSTSTTILFTIASLDFRVDNIRFELPISTDPSTAPTCSRALWFVGSPNARYQVSNCEFIGGRYGIFVAGLTKFVQINDNVVTGQWSEGILLQEATDALIVDNIMRDGGYVNGGSSGAIRLGALTSQTTRIENIVIADNSISSWSVLYNQEAIDLSCGAARNIVVSGNVMDGCGNGGVEIKTSPDTALSPDIYQRILVVGNEVRMRNTPPNNNGVGIGLNNLTAPAGKAAKVTIVGNSISSDDIATSGWGQNGITVQGYTDVTIASNDINNLARGINPQGTGPSGATATRIAILGNRVRVVDSALITGTGTINGLDVVGNVFETTTGNVVSMASGTINDVYFAANRLTGLAARGLELRDVHDAVFLANFIDSNLECALSQSTAGDGIVFDKNHVRSATLNAFILGTGTYKLINNTVTVLDTKRGWSGAATVTAAGNVRGTVTSDPTSSKAAAVGDVWLNSAPGVGGVERYVAVTAGDAGSAVYNAVMLRSLTSGSVTQTTSKSTGVTLNAARGTITMDAELVNASGFKLFALTNSHIGANDFVAVTHSAGGSGGCYAVLAGSVTGGSCEVRLTNISAGPLSEAVILQFVVIKAP